MRGYRVDLNNKRALGVIAWLGTEVLYPCAPVISQIITAQTVLFQVNLFEKLGFERHPHRIVDEDLKDRELNPLSVIDAELGDTPQPLAAGRRLGIHVVGD